MCENQDNGEMVDIERNLISEEATEGMTIKQVGDSYVIDYENCIITRKNIIDVMPYFNSLYVKEITGEAFLDALEFGVSKLPSASGGFPQVSGCTYDVDTTFNSTVESDSDGLFIKVAGKRRVSNVKINGKPLDLTAKYNLSASDYILYGGDGYTMFSEFPVVNESVYADSDALGHYIKNNLNGEIPSKYKELQGRS